MAFKLPTDEEIKELGASFGLEFSDDHAAGLSGFMAMFAEGYDAVEALPDELPDVKYPRDGWHRPEAGDNPLGAWLVKCSIKGAPTGKLAGRTVAIKDTVAVAGLPLTCGTSLLDDYIADFDATVVTRLLDAGAEITGKAVCEYFCTSGGSVTSATGPVRNPRNPDYSTGGSSSGCAALIGAGEVDLALGGDQGGSVRIPASYTGIYGMKPTHGLVPYSGIMGMEASIDHAGPMTANVADNALMLEVLAGEDGFDSRQHSPLVEPYTEALGRGARGLRIGFVTEGYGQPFSEADVDECVRAAASHFAGLGAHVEEVSIPMHPLGQAIWTPIAIEGFYHTLMLGGAGYNAEGVAMTSLHEALRDWPERAGELPYSAMFLLLMARQSINENAGGFYAKAQNLRRGLRAAYDAALDRYDLLAMPTTTMKSTRLPDPDGSLEDIMLHCLTNIGNTCQFDVSGHPAMSIPCGLREDLPVGLMLVAKNYGEPTIYQAAHAFEQSADWRDM